MRWPRVAFVAAPEPDAQVRFEFQDDMEQTLVVKDSWSLGAPSVEGDVDGIGTSYSLREISLTLAIWGSKSHAMRVQSTLAREMLRRSNWLLFQVTDTAAPVWFKTWQANVGDLSFDLVHTDGDDDRWEIEVTIPAEPFARGERVTLPAVTVNLNPAAATNPCSLVIPAQPGDAPCPLRLDVAWSATRDGYRSLVAATPNASAPVVWDVGVGDAWTAGPATAAGAAYANTAGGSARLFAATGLVQTIISGPAPAALPAGQYRVWARVLRETTDGEFAVRFSTRFRNGASAVTGAYTHTAWGATVADFATWVDLGVHSFPAGQPIPEGVSVTPDIGISAYRTSGTGGLRLDSLLMQPIVEGSRSLLVDRGYGPATGATERIDGEAEAVTHRTAADAPESLQPPATAGGFPLLHPGRNTLVTLLAQTKIATARFAGAETPDVVAQTASVTVSFQPWWLWIGDS